jgi:hypothetical protein
MAILTTITNQNQNELARTLRHEGIRVGEIIAYRAWRVFKPHWWWQGDDRYTASSCKITSGTPINQRRVIYDGMESTHFGM